MPRRRPETGLDDLVRAAANVFARQGYRRTQMADIAKEMGVSAGTLYGYVESKEALFDLTVQRAFVDGPDATPALPVPTPPPGQLLDHVRDRLGSVRSAALVAANEIAEPPAGDAEAELSEIAGEIYAFVDANREGLGLIESAANDRPELAAFYYERVRAGLLDQLECYLQARIDGGWLEKVPDVAVAARLLVETIVWFARHRYDDYDGAVQDDEVARETVIQMLVRSMARRTS